MPVKKTKKTKKKTATKKKIEKDIKEAVKKIPEFLFTKVDPAPSTGAQVETPKPAPAEIKAEIKDEPETTVIPPKPPVIDYNQYKTRRIILWASVLFLSAIIFGMWAWNMTTMWRDAKLKKSPEESLWQEAKTDINKLQIPTDELSAALEKNKIQEELKTQIEKEMAKAKIKNTIGQNLANYMATTTKTQ